jgi:hypothetical protein
MRVIVPTQLRGYTAGRAEVEARGATLADVLADLDRQFPGFRFRVSTSRTASAATSSCSSAASAGTI